MLKSRARKPRYSTAPEVGRKFGIRVEEFVLLRPRKVRKSGRLIVVGTVVTPNGVRDHVPRRGRGKFSNVVGKR